MWRAVAVFRGAALVYVMVAFVLLDEYFDHPEWGWLVVALMTAWTVAITMLYRTPRGRRSPVVVADVVVACVAIAATPLVDDPDRIVAGEPTLALVWPVAAVLAAAVKWGLAGGVGAGLAASAFSLFARGEFAWTTARNIVLLMVTGSVVGYAAGLFRASQVVLVRALRVETATRERERLARSVHDGVLQVLAMVQRRAADLGGEGPSLARMAGEQEVALRALVSQPLAPTLEETLDETTDLAVLLTPLTSGRVSVARPSAPVILPTKVAERARCCHEGLCEQRRTTRRFGR